LGALLVTCAAAGSAFAGPTPPPAGLVVSRPVLLPGSAVSSEPRIAVDPRSDVRYAISNAGGTGTATVWSSRNGLAFSKTANDLPGQSAATIDLDIAVLPTGRVVANELDAAGLTFPTGYSDDHGKTWSASTGIPYDVDRQWLAVGPGNRVYLAYHNFASGLSPVHEILVQMSSDGGKTFGVPVPVALPGSPAAVDLGCGDSTGPSGLAVDQRTGRVYVAFGTRTSAVGGGCGKAADPNEGAGFNVVPSNHLWVASSPDNAPGSWTTSLAVDTAAARKFIALQYAGLAVDGAGDVWVSYTESTRPDSYVSEVRLRSAPSGGVAWRRPVVVPGTAGGSLFALVAAGDHGKLAVSWLAARGSGAATRWIPRLAVTRNALSATPSFAFADLSAQASHLGTPAQMSASCGTGPTSGLQQGLTCGRFLDNFGIAIDRAGRAMVVWPSRAEARGTFVATQLSGPAVRG